MSDIITRKIHDVLLTLHHGYYLYCLRNNNRVFRIIHIRQFILVNEWIYFRARWRNFRWFLIFAFYKKIIGPNEKVTILTQPITLFQINVTRILCLSFCLLYRLKCDSDTILIKMIHWLIFFFFGNVFFHQELYHANMMLSIKKMSRIENNISIALYVRLIIHYNI